METMEGAPAKDRAYFTLDHHWTLLDFLIYRVQFSDFLYGNGYEHNRYSCNLEAIVRWEKAPAAAVKKAKEALANLPKESKSVNSFWENASLAEKQRLAFIAERTILMEQQHTSIAKSAFEQDRIIREFLTKRLISSENDHPEKRKFDSVAGETSTSSISSRPKIESETCDGPFDQVILPTDYESDIDCIFGDDTDGLLPKECAVVEEEVKAKIEQDWKKWGAELRHAAKRSKHKYCPENSGIIRCGPGIQCSDWMANKLYQSLQSSLPRADRAPFADYNSSISGILTQISLEDMLEDLHSKAPPVNEPRGSKYYIMDRVFSQFARNVFMPDDRASNIGMSEVCYNHLALWPCMYAAVSGLTSSLGNVTFQPGEIYLRAIDEIRKFRHQPESHMKVDGVVHIDFARIELLSMEVTGHHGLHDKNRAGWDHAKGIQAALAMLSRIAHIFIHGSVDLFQDVKVAFVHAHGMFLHLWLFNMPSPGIFVMQRIAKATVPAKFNEADLLCELINFLWTLRVEISKTMKALVQLKASHAEKALGIKLQGEKRGQYLYEVLRPVVASQRSKIVTVMLDKKGGYAGVGECVAGKLADQRGR